MMESEKMLPKLAINLFEEAESEYCNQKCFSDTTMKKLYSIYGDVFFEACEFLESYNFKLIEYQTEDLSTSVFKISNQNEQFTLYRDINFCYCPAFSNIVLKNKQSLTCKHILAVRLGRIIGNYSTETLKDSQFIEYLNGQLHHLKEN